MTEYIARGAGRNFSILRFLDFSIAALPSLGGVPCEVEGVGLRSLGGWTTKSRRLDCEEERAGLRSLGDWTTKWRWLSLHSG